jgi:hypothetical protein
MLVGQQPIMRCLSEQIGESLVVVEIEVKSIEFLVEVRGVDEQHGMAARILDQWGEVEVGDPGVSKALRNRPHLFGDTPS